MSAQVVIPTKPSSLQPKSTTTTVGSPTKHGIASSKSGHPRSPSVPASANRNRFRPPRKPEIQMDKNELKQKLTPLQYKVTQEKFTERAFTGEYVRLNDDGIYCCVVCGEELFSSQTKYDSGCGWPAFFDTIDPEKLILQTDLSHVGGNLLLLALNQDLARTEVTCAKCGSHLGHVFDDGPRPTGKRYCLNSASLKFRKANGEEVICDIPVTNGGGCCFMPRKQQQQSVENFQPPPAVKIESKESLTKAIQSLKPVGGLNSSTITNKPVPLPSSSTTAASETIIEANHSNQQHSTHARRTQMNRENFFKASSPSTTRNTAKNSFMINQTDIERQRNNHQQQFGNRQPAAATTLLSRTKKPDEAATSLKPDWNNNNQPRSAVKFSDVKSRYLDHLDAISKNQVLKHTALFGPKKLSSATSSSNTNNGAVLESDL